MKASITSEAAVMPTEGQKRTYRQLLEVAADRAARLALQKVAPDRHGLQRVIERGDEIMDVVANAIITGTRQLSVDRYKKEEKGSSWSYSTSYKRNTVEKQIDILRSSVNFPFLDPDPAIKYFREVYGSLRQSEWVEGPFVIIPTTAFQKHCFPDADGAKLLCDAVNLGIEKLGASRPVVNLHAGRITPDHFRRKARYAAMYDQLYATQPGSDLIVVGGQYGKFHGGQSMRRSLERMQGKAAELPAGTLEGVVMALANPTRYSELDELGTYLPADEFRSEFEVGCLLSPWLDLRGDTLLLGMTYADSWSEDCGSVSLVRPRLILVP